ncbi:hypothetical protein ABFV57_10130 [Pseudomonas neuropathica]|jgi:hypothetical protein|uniref:hypothetical protein n=1 Tax=Pseudomonas TaxID=286 RepID=UPI0006D6FC3D|nr:hypothetical protein [Pseudomonas sp. RIT-PI-r]KPG94597.1 hypothetical protein AK821_18460 [Pseudomonas sp. RIT-PI-r]
MKEQAMDFSGFPDLPTYEADWAAIYMEPIVQSGERLTIGVVASDGTYADGQLAISEKALQCLYGESAAGMKAMMEMALKRALGFAQAGFHGEFSSGMHGVSLGKKRRALGDDLEDIILQGISLTSSLSDLHADEDAREGHERSAYWRRFQVAMKKFNPLLSSNFGRSVEVSILGSSISLPCDYFSTRFAVNICGLQPGYRLSQLFDAASSRISRLEQIKNHDGLIAHDHKASLLLVTPTELQVDHFKETNQKAFREKILLLQDMANSKDFDLLTVSTVSEGAGTISKMEQKAA